MAEKKVENKVIGSTEGKLAILIFVVSFILGILAQ
jgi:hypothetical protein